MGYIGKITAGGGTHLVGSTLYGTCSDSAGTVAKTVTCSDFDALLVGVTIHVKFTNSNLAANPTLNVNGTGARRIYRYGTTSPSASVALSWFAGSVVSFTYDGDYWQMNGWQETDGGSYGVCDTSPNTVMKSVSIAEFELKEGAVVHVKFVNDNSATNPTLNVSESGAKPIYQYGTSPSGIPIEVDALKAGAVACFVYDGTAWIMESGGSTESLSDLTNGMIGHGYGTCSTPESTQAKVGILDDYSLVTGGIVSIQFSNNVPASSTLNINGQGARSIYYNGMPISANIIQEYDTATFIYDGYQYHLLAIDRWAEDVGGLVANIGSHTVETDVPAGAVFTDTTYTASTGTVTSITNISAITADEITSWSDGSMTTVTYANEVLTITNGTKPSLTHTPKTLPNISVTNVNVVTSFTETTSGA